MSLGSISNTVTVLWTYSTVDAHLKRNLFSLIYFYENRNILYLPKILSKIIKYPNLSKKVMKIQLFQIHNKKKLI